MSVVARIALATVACCVLGVALVVPGLVGGPLLGPALLLPGLAVAVALANDWTFARHAIGAFVASFVACAATGFMMSAPAFLIGVAWGMAVVLGMGLAVPFRLVRGARTRLAPEPTTRAARRRAAAR